METETDIISRRVREALDEIASGNSRGERITLVAATKTRTPEEIAASIRAGIADVGENRVQEFCEKYDAAEGARRHFIGRLQRNKVKYLIGRTFLIHSVDSDALADEIAVRSLRAGIVSDVLVEINAGGEESKGGFPIEEGMAAFRRLSAKEGLRVRGFMAMLPRFAEEDALGALCDKMRALYDAAREESETVAYLSMGMSEDYRICIRHGANMIRLGTRLFGGRA